jgi:hypothetical protein
MVWPIMGRNWRNLRFHYQPSQRPEKCMSGEIHLLGHTTDGGSWRQIGHRPRFITPQKSGKAKSPRCARGDYRQGRPSWHDSGAADWCRGHYDLLGHADGASCWFARLPGQGSGLVKMVSPPVDRRSADLPSTLFNYPQDKEKAAPRRNYSAQLWQSFDWSDSSCRR